MKDFHFLERSEKLDPRQYLTYFIKHSIFHTYIYFIYLVWFMPHTGAREQKIAFDRKKGAEHEQNRYC
jgi:hypothetical protein